MLDASYLATSTRDSESHSLYTALKRLFHTLIVSAILAFSVVLVLLFQQYQNDWLVVQTRFSGESIARQYAKLFQITSDPATADQAQSKSNNNGNDLLHREQIEKIASVLVNEPHILALAVFDKEGRYIAPYPKIESIVTLSKTKDVTPLSYVAPIENNEGVVIGYVNIHMNTDAMLESPLTLRYQLTTIACILVFLALMMGIYITRGFYKFRPWLVHALAAKKKESDA